METTESELATVIVQAYGEGADEAPCEQDLNVAAHIIKAGYRKVFDGDCGLNGIKDPSDREAAEAWMRFSNITLGNGHDAIGAMKQMLAEFGYQKPAPHE